VSVDLSSMLSKDGETHNEVDLLLSTLGTAEHNSSSEETVRSLQPCSTTQETRQHTVSVLEPSSTSEEICTQTLATSEPCSTSQHPHLTVDSATTNAREAHLSSVSDDGITSSVTQSDRTFGFVGGTHSVLESSAVSHSNQNCDIMPLTSSLSTQLDMDHSIVMTTVLSTSTPLDMEDSTAARTLPTSSAYVINMEQQFTAQRTSSTHG